MIWVVFGAVRRPFYGLGEQNDMREEALVQTGRESDVPTGVISN